MDIANPEGLTKTRLVSLRNKWSKPDEAKGKTWEFDGIPYSPDAWDSYNHEMRDGLNMLGCKTFDQLVGKLNNKLRHKPNVVDLMGGAYFLEDPEKTFTLTGIRIHDKDRDFNEIYKDGTDDFSRRFRKIIQSPNRKVFEADVLSNEGWATIRHNLPLADLLVCRPVGPFDNRNSLGDRFDNPNAYAGLYISLFKRMLGLVNKKSGVIFTEVPDVYSDGELKKFFTQLDRTEESQTTLFTVLDEDYHWGGAKRRYAVIQFSLAKSF
jgi:hypothetical protein